MLQREKMRKWWYVPYTETLFFIWRIKLSILSWRYQYAAGLSPRGHFAYGMQREPWIDFYQDRYTPRQALDEDASYA